MARYNDEEDSGVRDYGRSSRGGSSSNSSGKDGKIDASKLADAIIADGRLFGVKMPQETIDNIRKIIPTILMIATDKGQDLVTRHHGAKAGQIAGIAIAFSEQIAETAQNLYNLVTSLDNLHATMRPAAKAAGSASALTMNNEAIEDLRAKIVSLFMHRMMDTVVGAIGAIPALAVSLGKTSAKAEKYAVQEQLQATKGDPNAIADILEAQYHGAGKAGLTKGITGAQIAAGEKVLIDRKLDIYVKEFEAFGKARGDAIRKEMTELVKDLNPTEYPLQVEKLKKMGLPVASLEQNVKEMQGMGPQQRLKVRQRVDPKATEISREDHLKEIIDEWRKSLLGKSSKGRVRSAIDYKNLDAYVETALKKQYVREKGVFNNDWRQYAEGEAYKAQTHEDELKEAFKKQRADQQQLVKEGDEAEKKLTQDSRLKMLWDSGPALIAGFMRDFVIQLVGGKSMAKLQKPLPAERVAHLDKVLTAPKDAPSNWRPPEKVPRMLDGHSKAGKSSDESLTEPQSYSRFIHEIFQAQQSYHTRPEVGARFTPNFDAVRWDDKEIIGMSDDKLTPYEYAIRHITKRVMDGRLAVSAILNFIGDKHGNRIVLDDGQTFGPNGGSRDDAKIKEGLLKVIDDNTTMVRVDHAVTPEQLSAKMAEWLFKSEDVKGALEAKDGDPQWQNFTFKLFSDVVGSDAVVCEKLGIKNERCQELRKASTEFNERLDALISVLARKLDENSKVFDEVCDFGKSGKEMVASLNEQRIENGNHVADITENREQAGALLTLALNAVMKLGNQPDFQKEVKDEMDEIKKRKEAAAEAEETRGKPDARTADRDDEERSSRRRNRADAMDRNPHFEEEGYSHAERVRRGRDGSRNRNTEDERDSRRDPDAGREEYAARRDNWDVEERDSRSSSRDRDDHYSGSREKKWSGDEHRGESHEKRVRRSKDSETLARGGIT